MEIDVHHIEAHIARATSTQHGIEIGSVVIHQASAVVDEFCNLRDTGLEKTKGIGIGHHHGSNLCTLISNNALQVIEINLTISL